MDGVNNMSESAYVSSQLQQMMEGPDKPQSLPEDPRHVVDNIRNDFYRLRSRPELDV